MRRLASVLLWGGISALGAAGFGVLALSQGETVNAAWLLVAAVCTYAVAYRFYSRFLAARVFGLDERRATPAERFNNGRDFVPTNKWVLYGHHFAAIAGAGPLVGPVLAAQFGFLPGTIWLAIGVVLGGAALLLLALVGGGWVATHPTLGPAFTHTGVALTAMMIGYGFVASVLPVWMLLCPRDYLSTFLKITTVLALGVAILVILPPLRMPALTPFATLGEGPVFAGKLFPFAFITIACGAISGFHALVASGTTPKMIERESDARMIGYGGMLMESFVGVMAMIAACTPDPRGYFAMDTPAAAPAPGADL